MRRGWLSAGWNNAASQAPLGWVTDPRQTDLARRTDQAWALHRRLQMSSTRFPASATTVSLGKWAGSCPGLLSPNVTSLVRAFHYTLFGRRRL